MIEVKTVSRGNSLALSLPKNGPFKKGQKWLLIPSSDGKSFTLIPRISNPYAKSKSSNTRMPEEWGDIDFSEFE
ncbi:type II toxin-antitoxin system PemI/MazE family antitoxin [Lentilactobacillus raoultii]|uniref:Type II toxin-antitoxin system PemI/MazE family antitoxin n=1 Tax=Lentilactobacillus raoultii TaxID=1987503 RepID=A0ABW3PPQ5_9LACO|nr:transcription elongation factor GreAB [Lentilactobacillus raoultii]